MQFIKENPMKFLSVQLPVYGAFVLTVLPLIIEQAMHTKIIPTEYHATLVSVVLPMLALLGRIIKQPKLHQKGETK